LIQSDNLSLLTPYPAATKSFINKKLLNPQAYAIWSPSKSDQDILTEKTLLSVTAPAIPTTPTDG
jgi:hypothetical protein